MNRKNQLLNHPIFSMAPRNDPINFYLRNLHEKIRVEIVKVVAMYVSPPKLDFGPL